MHLRDIRRLLHLHLHGVSILGRRVDCFYFSAARSNEVGLRGRFEAQKLSTGESRFKMEAIKFPQFTVPKGPRDTGERESQLDSELVFYYNYAAWSTDGDERVIEGAVVHEPLFLVPASRVSISCIAPGP